MATTLPAKLPNDFTPPAKRAVLSERLLSGHDLFNAESVLIGIALLEKTYSDAILSGKFDVVDWEDDGQQSYDGTFYDLMGTKFETDAEYDASVLEAYNDYLERKAAERTRDDLEKRRLAYNKVADREGWPQIVRGRPVPPLPTDKTFFGQKIK